MMWSRRLRGAQQQHLKCSTHYAKCTDAGTASVNGSPSTCSAETRLRHIGAYFAGPESTCAGHFVCL
ncbi:hypothetical protein V5799_025923 [Amblyomma americanum]|uniref:Uncharacterized protein n=1 Tax=Amblyomma americanum TaxID=6943 RepID=A0AAQ4DK12_AMBAM